MLLGFAATDFLITMTLSAADASTHLLENAYAPDFLHGQRFAVTLVLLAAGLPRALKAIPSAPGRRRASGRGRWPGRTRQARMAGCSPSTWTPRS